MVTSSSHNSVFKLGMDACRSECDSGKHSLNRLQWHIVGNHTMPFLFQYLDMRFRELWSPFTKFCKESVSEH